MLYYHAHQTTAYYLIEEPDRSTLICMRTAIDRHYNGEKNVGRVNTGSKD